MPSLRPHLLAAVLLACGASAAPAAEAALPPARLSYGIYVAGFPIARADLDLDGRRDRYAAAVDWRTTGIAGVFAAASGRVSAHGRLAAAAAAPSDYRLSGTSGDRRVDVAMGLSGGRVGRLTAEPPAREGEDIVPMRPEHRSGVIDPLSAALVPGGVRPEKLCARAVPIFDGWSRWTVALSPQSTRDDAPAGMRGPTVTCSARWIPVAGHRAGHRSVRYMADNRDIEIRFARLADRDLWLPIEASVGTLIGPARAVLDGVAPAPKATTR